MIRVLLASTIVLIPICAFTTPGAAQTAPGEQAGRAREKTGVNFGRRVKKGAKNPISVGGRKSRQALPAGGLR